MCVVSSLEEVQFVSIDSFTWPPVEMAFSLSQGISSAFEKDASLRRSAQ